MLRTRVLPDGLGTNENRGPDRIAAVDVEAGGEIVLDDPFGDSRTGRVPARGAPAAHVGSP